MRPHLMTSGAFLIAATAVSAEERTYDLTGFDAVEVSAGITANVTVGADYGVVGEAIKGDIENLDIVQVGTQLMISRETDRSWGLIGLLRKDDRFVVTVTLPELTAVDGNSGASVDVVGATTALLQAEASSGASLDITGADLGEISLEATSGASLTISGACDAVAAQATSGASLSARKLTCSAATLDASSGASLSAYADTTATVEASSGASLSVRGGADVTEQSVSSGASVSIR
ncbi:MAG: DUF2807 domain-containing protein [Pseudomonadota bacterium]